MQRVNRLALVAVASFLVFFGIGVPKAFAADVLLTGPFVYDFNDLAAADGGINPAVYEVSGNLTLQSGAVIECNDPASPAAASACPITIVVTGNMLMEAGSAITADQTVGGGNAGDITITVGGDMTMCGPIGGQPGCASPGPAALGALISAQRNDTNVPTAVNTVEITVGDKTKATGNFYMEGGSTTYGAETGAKIITDSFAGKSGNIDITAGNTYFSEPGSVLQSGFGVGTTQIGGKIFVVSNCGLTTEGRITSKGPDPGADLVHLESCEVIVRGLVESTGNGHAANAKNSCDLVNDGIPGEVLRNHPAESTGCIEVWGNVITIDSSTINPATGLPWAGELNADIGNGGSEGTSWIDIFAYSTLTVIDGAGNDRISDNGGHTYFSTYAVHANALSGSDQNPSVVTAKVKNGPLTASGKAFEASSTLTSDTGHGASDEFVGNGSNGGTIDLEASGTVTLDNAFVNASGDFLGGSPCPSGSGACGNGGHIFVSAWGAGSDVLWRNGDGDVRTNDSGSGVVGGTIDLNACDQIDIAGTNFHGEVPTETHICDVNQPTIPVIAAVDRGPVFKQDLWALCGGSSISGIKFNDLNGNGVKDAGEPGLNGWVIHIFNTPKTVHQTFTTAGGGNYTFTGLPTGTYTICEQLQTGWQQTSPVAGAGVVSCAATVDTPVDNPTPGPLGYTVVIADCCAGGTCTGTPITGKNFGNIQLATKTGVKWNDVNGNHVRDLPGDVGLNGWVIHLFGTAVNGSSVHQTTTTAGGGVYTFTVLPGNYTVCEQLQPLWSQTFPTAGATCTAAGDPMGDNPTPGPIGYAIVLTGGEIETGNDFGNFQTPLPPGCPEDPNRAALLTRIVIDLSKALGGGGVAGNPQSYHTVQAAYNAAKASGQAEVIGLFANTSENLLLDGSKSLTITQCTVARVTGAAGSPVWNITSTGKLTIIGPDAVGGSIGWRVAGNGGHKLGSVRANGAALQGILITSNSNNVSWNAVSGNGTGIRVEGNSNTLKGGTVEKNSGDGVQLAGNSNNLSGANILSNGGNGVLVAGTGNTVKGNGRINLNTKNGVQVTGSNNTIQSNGSESGKGNTLNGIHVSAGTGNQLTDNKMQSNGQAGFNLGAGTGTKVKGNANANNTGNEFTIGSGNVDQNGNKKGGAGFTFTNLGGNFN